MYLLDTNVLSEMMKDKTHQDSVFLEWTQHQILKTLFVSSFSLSEVYQGIYLLAEGKKQRRLYESIKNLEQLFDNTILDFDRLSAAHYGRIRGRTKASGLTMHPADSYYLAVAERHHLTLVSRNVSHFMGRTELDIVNPWTFQPH